MGRVGKFVVLLLVPFAAAVAPTTVDAQTCGLSAGGTLTGVINSYYPGTADAAAGATSISVGAIDPNGAANAIASGDLLLVIQMQDADINTTNGTTYGSGTGNAHGVTALNSAGLYEYVVAQGAVTAGAVSIRGNGNVAGNNGLVNSYHSAAATGTAGKRTFQVISVPMYLTATLSNGLTAAPWNGATGGVLAFEVAGVLTLGSSTVSLDGLGFRGAAGRALLGDTTGTSAGLRPTHRQRGPRRQGRRHRRHSRWVYDSVGARRRHGRRRVIPAAPWRAAARQRAAAGPIPA
jgi:hypothetical protein